MYIVKFDYFVFHARSEIEENFNEINSIYFNFARFIQCLKRHHSAHDIICIVVLY